MNPPECVWEILIPHYHQDHIAGKGENSLQHYNLVHKFIPMPQAMKIPAATRTSGATVHFASFNGHLSSEKC